VARAACVASDGGGRCRNCLRHYSPYGGRKQWEGRTLYRCLLYSSRDVRRYGRGCALLWLGATPHNGGRTGRCWNVKLAWRGRTGTTAWRRAERSAPPFALYAPLFRANVAPLLLDEECSVAAVVSSLSLIRAAGPAWRAADASGRLLWASVAAPYNQSAGRLVALAAPRGRRGKCTGGTAAPGWAASFASARVATRVKLPHYLPSSVFCCRWAIKASSQEERGTRWRDGGRADLLPRCPKRLLAAQHLSGVGGGAGLYPGLLAAGGGSRGGHTAGLAWRRGDSTLRMAPYRCGSAVPYGEAPRRWRLSGNQYRRGRRHACGASHGENQRACCLSRAPRRRRSWRALCDETRCARLFAAAVGSGDRCTAAPQQRPLWRSSPSAFRLLISSRAATRLAAGGERETGGLEKRRSAAAEKWCAWPPLWAGGSALWCCVPAMPCLLLPASCACLPALPRRENKQRHRGRHRCSPTRIAAPHHRAAALGAGKLSSSLLTPHLHLYQRCAVLTPAPFFYLLTALHRTTHLFLQNNLAGMVWRENISMASLYQSWRNGISVSNNVRKCMVKKNNGRRKRK